MFQLAPRPLYTLIDALRSNIKEYYLGNSDLKLKVCLSVRQVAS